MRPSAYAAIGVVAGAAGFLVYMLRPELPPATTPVVVNVPDPSVTHRPMFTLTDIDGQSRSIAEWDNKALVINFWATWCPPCRREIPLLKTLQTEYENDGVQIIGVAVDFFDEVVEYAARSEINYPVLVGEQDAIEAAEGFGVEFVGLPFTIFTDHSGRIVRRHTGELHREQALVILETIADLRAGTVTRTEAEARLDRRLAELSPAAIPAAKH